MQFIKLQSLKSVTGRKLEYVILYLMIGIVSDSHKVK
ncbi:hypothetical protein DYBT9275_04224 [Dyadobacter sp. CECT 9275]|uniref:Uncharacterized protein n=1 Tax=Dyadobacter helix TaxID=2822344 RepID=A0A916JE16_9BACT|nr:hypothetical protein DYBT9275_04224 [Dyadobacter sp. CECT 9275]